MKGYIYVLSNPSFKKDILKIGMTSRKDISLRLKELFNTSLPFPFRCEYLGLVNDMDNAEISIHHYFNYYRLNPNREFFKLNLEDAIQHIEGLVERDCTEYISHDSCPWSYQPSQEYFKKLVKKRGAYLTPNDILNLKYQSPIYHRIHGKGLLLSASWKQAENGRILVGNCYFDSLADILGPIDVSGASIVTF